jgi:hypothetical protein
MDVVIAPHIAAKGASPTRVTLTVRGYRATITCDSSKSRAYTVGTMKYTRTVAVTVSVASSVTSGKITVYAHVDGANTKAADAKALSLTVKKPKSPARSRTTPSATTPSVPTTPTGVPSPTVTPPQTASLPDMTQQQAQTPATAPVQNSSNSQSMRGTSDAADELTFDKLASTQAAWLAALLVAFSLLLTQVRLGRTTAKDAKPKGTHRKSRRTRRAH